MLSFMRKQWRSFLLAVGFFTRIAVPSFADFEEHELNDAAKYFPLIGVIVGLFGAGVFLLSAYVFPNAIAVLLSMAATIYLTGAFHEDGLADSADGLGGGWDKERILTIMQDSRLGTYGAIALIGVLFAKFQLLTELPQSFIAYALIIAHALSRLSAVYMMATLRYVKPSGKAKPLATKLGKVDLVIASIFGLLPLVFLQYYFFPLVIEARHILALLICVLMPVVAIWWWWRLKIKRWLGGYTGDCLGATQQLTELAIYLGFVAYFGSIRLF
jgi:adenosylcobinamide-GDP ribazoletransferase